MKRPHYNPTRLRPFEFFNKSVWAKEQNKRKIQVFKNIYTHTKIETQRYRSHKRVSAKSIASGRYMIIINGWLPHTVATQMSQSIITHSLYLMVCRSQSVLKWFHRWELQLMQLHCAMCCLLRVLETQIHCQYVAGVRWTLLPAKRGAQDLHQFEAV